MQFKFTLERTESPGKFAFVTVEDAVDLEDAVNAIQQDFPGFTIESFREIDTHESSQA